MLAGFVNGLFLVFIAFFILSEAVEVLENKIKLLIIDPIHKWLSIKYSFECT